MEGDMTDADLVSKIDLETFSAAVAHFHEMVRANAPGGRGFISFDEGVIASEEGYKLRVREIALERLSAHLWQEEDIGSGDILAAVISAIEIDEGRSAFNNLLEWQGRNGPSARDHNLLVESRGAGNGTSDLERIFFRLYRGEEDPKGLFEDFVDLMGRNYPLIGYLWFIKDAEKYVPVRPKGLQDGLQRVGIDLRLMMKCSWKNYADFISVLQNLRPVIAEYLALENVALMDAHSFIWVVGRWTKPKAGTSSGGLTFSDIDRAAYIMASNIGRTVDGANGQIVERRVKPKETDMPFEERIKYIATLIREQEGLCAVTGLPFLLPPDRSDTDMVASVDRIDSDLGYVRGNLHVVCWFINRWKSDDGMENFRRLLAVVRNETSTEFF